MSEVYTQDPLARLHGVARLLKAVAMRGDDWDDGLLLLADAITQQAVALNEHLEALGRPLKPCPANDSSPRIKPVVGQ